MTLPHPLTPEDLARTLTTLRVQVDSVHCHSGALALADYPDGPRPSGVLALSGQGVTGYGENVAFTAQAQHAFALEVQHLRLVQPHAVTVGARMQSLPAGALDPYARAAVEAALIDLGLRQAKLSLAELCGRTAAPLRWAASFGALAAPASHLHQLRSAGVAREFKLDVDPTWSDATIAALAAVEGLVIIDFKERGHQQLAARLATACPGTIFEDPPTGSQHRHIARDRSLLTTADVESAARRDEAVNLKAPRMGGPLALLSALALARRWGVQAYVGGMFEIGPGRTQARQLAAIFTGDAPNDLGPIAGGLSPPLGPSPCPIRLDLPGFGAVHDHGAGQQEADLFFQQIR